MKSVILTVCLAVLVSCAPKSTEPDVTLFDVDAFTSEVEGKPISLYTLKAGYLVMQVTNFGGRVVSLWTPDKAGKYEDIVLGYNNIESYINNSGERFLGAVVGPCANRIAGASYTIGDQTYHFPKNDKENTLHGGMKGLDMLVWDVDSVSNNQIVLSVFCPDGYEGMPGNRKIVMTYTLTPDNEFKIDYIAETDKATHVNISHHSFFNLKGEGNGTINDHVMCINASRTTPITAAFVPTGEIVEVAGTPFDFREPKAIGTDLYVENEQLTNGVGYDHNWILDRKSDSDMELAATVWEPVTGRFMEVWSDQPALQFYGGNFFDGTTCGKYGKALNFRESIVLETQKYPDTPHHAHFPSTLLNPGEKYTHSCIYKFGVK